MENEIIFLVEETPGGGYTARALGYDIFTEADSFAELKRMVQDAIQCHFKDEEMPRLIRLQITAPEHRPISASTPSVIVNAIADHLAAERQRPGEELFR